jgi:hypothetical protein
MDGTYKFELRYGKGKLGMVVRSQLLSPNAGGVYPPILLFLGYWLYDSKFCPIGSPAKFPIKPLE